MLFERKREMAYFITAIMVSLVAASLMNSCGRRSIRVTRSPLLVGTVEQKLQSLGVGMWLWQPERCPCDCGIKHRGPWTVASRSRHYTSLAEQARRRGIGFVLIKAHDGTRTFHRFHPSLVQAFAERDIKVLVWGYNYCSFPDEEAKLIHQVLCAPGVVGYVANTEAHVKNKAENAQRMMALVSAYRRECVNCRWKLIGYAPYAYPSKHSSLPYPVFNRYCDFVAPQMYWATMGRSVKQVVNRTFHEWTRFDAVQAATGQSRSIPILPIGQSYGRAKPGQIREFLHRTRGYYAVCFWDWQHATPWMWEEIQSAAKRRLASR